MNRGADEWGFPWVTDTHAPDRFQVALSFSPVRDMFMGRRVERPILLRCASFARRCRRKSSCGALRRRRSAFRGPMRGCGMPASGPWRTGVEWWCQVSQWKREDWDIGLVDGGQTVIYRIFQDYGSGQWFMEGMYD
jgi:hypothetical protein